MNAIKLAAGKPPKRHLVDSKASDSLRSRSTVQRAERQVRKLRRRLCRHAHKVMTLAIVPR